MASAQTAWTAFCAYCGSDGLVDPEVEIYDSIAYVLRYSKGGIRWGDVCQGVPIDVPIFSKLQAALYRLVEAENGKSRTDKQPSGADDIDLEGIDG